MVTKGLSTVGVGMALLVKVSDHGEFTVDTERLPPLVTLGK
jgi:hypothetical protein